MTTRWPASPVAPRPVTLGHGAEQSATGTATDAADNSASATVEHLNIDKTAPSIEGHATTAPNGEGWYTGDVVIHWTCSDDLSGVVACPADTTITGEGDNLSATAGVSDRADHTTSATVSGIHIDRTAPVTTSDAPAGWQNTDVTVTLSPTDNLSGVAVTHYVLDGGATQDGTSVAVVGDGTHTLQFFSVDHAGNTETAQSVEVRIDKSNPTISHTQSPPANAAGWNNSAVNVHFDCADQPELSGVSSCEPDHTLSSDGANQTVVGTAVDGAGNTTQLAVTGINIDRTGPAITIDGIVNGGTYELGNAPAASCTASDVLSGALPCSGQLVGGTASGVGTFTYTATASDRAGNTTTRSSAIASSTPSTASSSP